MARIRIKALNSRGEEFLRTLYQKDGGTILNYLSKALGKGIVVTCEKPFTVEEEVKNIRYDRIAADWREVYLQMHEQFKLKGGHHNDYSITLVR